MATEQKDSQKELEILLRELEDRIDRLRATYEQYFMGFEKMEPAVQRKEVDRRFAHLRKQQIRNTAQRFRFGVITQKFNTYSMYWTRICRQIEEGTFKRHVLRAERRAADDDTSTRKKADARDLLEREASIDIDLGDLATEAFDMEAILAEAEAAADAHTRGPVDTLPPTPARPAPAPQVRPIQRPPTPGAPAALARPATPDAPAPPGLHHDGVRQARQVALKPGAKPVVIRRVDKDAAGRPLTPEQAVAPLRPEAPAHAQPATPAARPPAERTPAPPPAPPKQAPAPAVARPAPARPPTAQPMPPPAAAAPAPPPAAAAPARPAAQPAPPQPAAARPAQPAPPQPAAAAPKPSPATPAGPRPMAPAARPNVAPAIRPKVPGMPTPATPMTPVGVPGRAAPAAAPAPIVRTAGPVAPRPPPPLPSGKKP